MKTSHTGRFVLASILVVTLGAAGCGDDGTTTPQNSGTGTVTGTVIHSETGFPMSGVSITTTPGTQSLVTSIDGVYQITNVPVGQYAIQAEKTGYRDKTVMVQVQKGQTTVGDIVMEPSGSTTTGEIDVLQFDGNDDHILIPDDPMLDLSGSSFTIEAYFYAHGLPGTWQWIIGHGKRNSDVDYLLGFENDQPSFSVRASASLLKNSGPMIVLDQWYHIAAVQNAQAETISVYVNGVLMASIPLNGTPVLSAGDLFIGARERDGSGKPAELFEGLILDVRIWDHVRTQQQILAGMKSQPEGNEEGLIGYWPLSKGSGTVIDDISGHGHNGVMVGNPEWVRAESPYTE